MVPPKTTSESADALVALRTIYYSQLPQLNRTMGVHKSLWCMVKEDFRAGTDQAGITSNELIGRQAFLLDEPLRQAKDGSVLRLLPGNNTNYHQGSVHTRGDGILRGFGDGLLSAYGWRLGTELEGLGEYQKFWVAQRQPLWQSLEPEFEMTGMESFTDNAVNTHVVALQDRPLVGDLRSEALADKMYRQYIDEDQCCGLGG